MKRLLLFLLLAASCTAAAQKRPTTDGLSALQDSIWQWAADNKAADPVANAIPTVDRSQAKRAPAADKSQKISRKIDTDRTVRIASR